MTEPSTQQIADVMNLGLLKALTHHKVCQTGKMSLSRSKLEYVIQLLGGETHNSVKSTTTTLIVPNGEQFRKGSKYNAALRAGIDILSESEFCALILPSIDELYGGQNVPGASK